jgi:hypothetical protein
VTPDIPPKSKQALLQSGKARMRVTPFNPPGMPARVAAMPIHPFPISRSRQGLSSPSSSPLVLFPSQGRLGPGREKATPRTFDTCSVSEFLATNNGHIPLLLKHPRSRLVQIPLYPPLCSPPARRGDCIRFQQRSLPSTKEMLQLFLLHDQRRFRLSPLSTSAPTNIQNGRVVAQPAEGSGQVDRWRPGCGCLPLLTSHPFPVSRRYRRRWGLPVFC